MSAAVLRQSDAPRARLAHRHPADPRPEWASQRQILPEHAITLDSHDVRVSRSAVHVCSGDEEHEEATGHHAAPRLAPELRSMAQGNKRGPGLFLDLDSKLHITHLGHPFAGRHPGLVPRLGVHVRSPRPGGLLRPRARNWGGHEARLGSHVGRVGRYDRAAAPHMRVDTRSSRAVAVVARSNTPASGVENFAWLPAWLPVGLIQSKLKSSSVSLNE